MDKGALHDLRVTQHVIIATGDHAHHGAARREVHLSQACHRQCTRGLRDDAFVLVQVQHVRAHRTFIHISEVNSALVLLNDLVIDVTNTLDRRAVNEGIHVLQRDRFPCLHRCCHRCRTSWLKTNNGCAR